ncbi:MAG: sugar phosphate isomerase/epimerase, partial [Eubacteriales bacterium]|nr:sugar phosphate isomerase/epimerase [Eubacteriales bacterium]
KDNIKRQVDLAKDVGTDTVLVLPGAVGIDFVPGGLTDFLAYDKAYDVALAAYQDMAPYAEQADIYLGLENVWNKFLLSPLEMRDFIDKVNSLYVCSYFDVGNVVYSGYPEQWIKILNKRIRRVHFKDYRRDPGGLNAFCDLLSGDVDYPAVMKALREIGYNGYCTCEMTPYHNMPEQAAFNASASMDKIFGCIC